MKSYARLPCKKGGVSRSRAHARTAKQLRCLNRLAHSKHGFGWITLLAFFFVPGWAKASDRWETLQAIHMIENPTNSTRLGSKGELGPYQFLPGTWKMHTKKPFRLAADREESDAIAIKHYEWIKKGYERRGMEATSYRVALAWNAGLTAALKNSAPRSSHRYAERVKNIAEELKRQQLVREP
jgi:hypothetical protein